MLNTSTTLGDGNEEEQGQGGSNAAQPSEADPDPATTEEVPDPTSDAISSYWESWEQYAPEPEEPEDDPSRDEDEDIEPIPRLDLAGFKSAFALALAEHVAGLILKLNDLGAFNESSDSITAMPPAQLRCINTALQRWSSLVSAKDPSEVIVRLKEHAEDGYPVPEAEGEEDEP